MITFLWHSNYPHYLNCNVHLNSFIYEPKTLIHETLKLAQKTFQSFRRSFSTEVSLLFQFFIPSSKHRKFLYWSDYYSDLDCSFFLSSYPKSSTDETHKKLSDLRVQAVLWASGHKKCFIINNKYLHIEEKDVWELQETFKTSLLYIVKLWSVRTRFIFRPPTSLFFPLQHRNCAKFFHLFKLLKL